MNNNQENMNNNPQMQLLNSLNNNNNVNNSNLINQNVTEPLNVIPNSSPEKHIENENYQFDSNFIKPTQEVNNLNNQTPNTNEFINNQINITNTMEEENPILKLNQNKFINTNEEVKNTTLESMNVNGAYNNMPKVDYSTDPKVRQNIESINKYGAKNTIKIGSEGKVFLLIIVILLAFTFVMPTIYDAIRNAR